MADATERSLPPRQSRHRDTSRVDTHASALEQRGFTWIREDLPHPDTAFELARELVGARWPVDGHEAPIVVGDFVLPPLDRAPRRDFQTLHFDFGLPLDPRVPNDLGRWTALYVSPHVGPVRAATRLVPLRALLCQRCWPERDELLERLSSYGRTHGAWDDRQGYVEGSLARLVEAAAGERALPSVKLDPSFLCGMEFDSVTAEAAFFERHLLSLERVEVRSVYVPATFWCSTTCHSRMVAAARGARESCVSGSSETASWTLPASAPPVKRCSQPLTRAAPVRLSGWLRPPLSRGRPKCIRALIEL